MRVKVQCQRYLSLAILLAEIVYNHFSASWRNPTGKKETQTNFWIWRAPQYVLLSLARAVGQKWPLYLSWLRRSWGTTNRSWCPWPTASWQRILLLQMLCPRLLVWFLATDNLKLKGLRLENLDEVLGSTPVNVKSPDSPKRKKNNNDDKNAKCHDNHVSPKQSFNHF